MTYELFILVKKERIEANELSLGRAVVTSVVRSYLSEKRAFEDLHLLQEAQPEAIYDVLKTDHIDN
jgi:hypothetical protein